MNTVPKKNRTRHPLNRWLMLAAALILLCGTILAVRLLDRPVIPTPDSAVTYDEIHSYTAADVRSLTVIQQGQQPWTLTQDADGVCTLSGKEGWPLDASLVSRLLMVASVVSYEKVLTDNPADYAGHLADFGLEPPRLTVTVAYADGTDATMRIGNQVTGTDMASVYMLLDGDNRLFSLDSGTFDTLNIDASLLHAVVQPTIHKARIDRITLTGGSGETTAEWALQGNITDTDAASQWRMLTPWQYPADGETLASLRDNLATLRLGAFVCDATPEALAAYGFDAPRFVLTIHQAAGMTNVITADGTVEFVPWPESTVTLTVGNRKNSNVDYVLFDGAIYTASHFTLDVFMSLSPLDTLSRYPVSMAAAVLEEMTITQEGRTDVYTVARSTDTDSATGETVSRYNADRNGTPIAYDAFQAPNNRLETVRISGLLPDGWTPAEAPHTVFTFTNTAGLTQTVALATFDPMHDAVLIDGHAVFYLIKNGMVFSMSAE